MRDVLVFSVIRLLLLAALWWGLMALGVGFFFAGILAALLAMLVSLVLLRRPRTRAVERWQEADERRRERAANKRDVDADAEDGVLDPGTGPGGSTEASEAGAVPAVSDREAHQQQH